MNNLKDWLMEVENADTKMASSLHTLSQLNFSNYVLFHTREIS